jgi:hypothetical protein
MDLKATMFRFSIFVFLFILSLVFACSTPSWFPIKKGPSSWFPFKKEPPYKAKTKELLDKEVVIIDKEEYVKVYNPKASEGGNEPKYLYVPVNEYLSKRDAFIPSIARKEESKKESPVSPAKPPTAVVEQVYSVSPPVSAVPSLKKKVMIAYFDDRTTDVDEEFGDWITEKLIKEVSRRSARVLFVDYEMVKEFLAKREIALTDLETPKVLHLLNEVFGIHALVVGHLSGPYVFTTKAEKDKDGMASAIIKIEMRLVDTSTGKTLKNLSANNPIFATKEKGTFSEEKAKVKAIDLTIADLGRSLPKEIEGLDWFCRIAKVDGEDVYLNAGKLTGLKVGDVMEVFPPGEPGGQGEAKGKVQISTFFGVDASMGKLINGKIPDVDDILKMPKGKGT